MPQRLLSSLSHVELLTPDLQKSVDYARDILGLDVVEERGDSTYLRCWGDYYLYSLVLTAAAEPGLGHLSWRTEGPDQLMETVRRLRHAGGQGRWLEDSYGGKSPVIPSVRSGLHLAASVSGSSITPP